MDELAIDRDNWKQLEKVISQTRVRFCSIVLYLKSIKPYLNIDVNNSLST